jgi:acetyl/propionyl-CoA carboxylase alpha subunit
MKVALGEFKIGPVRTTIPLHRRLMDNADFANATFDIHYVERLLKADEVAKEAAAKAAKPAEGAAQKVTA